MELGLCRPTGEGPSVLASGCVRWPLIVPDQQSPRQRARQPLLPSSCASGTLQPLVHPPVEGESPGALMSEPWLGPGTGKALHLALEHAAGALLSCMSRVPGSRLSGSEVLEPRGTCVSQSDRDKGGYRAACSSSSPGPLTSRHLAGW